MTLNNQNLYQLHESIVIPQYQRDKLKQGIVHIGVGGFHRAHQAVYTHQLLQQGSSNQWGICGVGLRPADKEMQKTLEQQDYLYTLLEMGGSSQSTAKVIGSICNFLFAPENPEAVIEKLASPDTRIVSLTITEGGYNIDDHNGEFNRTHPDIIHDLQHPDSPVTVFGFIAEALDRRKQRQLPPFTLMSCDNVPQNGDVTRRALLSYAIMRDPELGDWITSQVSFPNSMVDRITPMTQPEHKRLVTQQYGIEDNWPVVCEPYMQWVLEDNFCNGRPTWEEVGVQLTDDVAPYEKMKIRLLNASHSAMAYLGYLCGFRYTHEVMNNSNLVQFIRDFMDIDVTPSLDKVPGIDLSLYKDTLIERFSNRQIGDQLTRLCMDGSSKIPKFLLPTVDYLIQNQLSLQRVSLIIASWALFLHRAASQEQECPIQDPLANELKSAVLNQDNLIYSLLGIKSVFGSELLQSKPFLKACEQSLAQLNKLTLLNNEEVEQTLNSLSQLRA
ncbi:mannitol dehydrogenase [Motiliproteus sp. MSK22-1]|nr:mannitol dehydrogenase [Motiliproteus sp. MSK22-1]